MCPKSCAILVYETKEGIPLHQTLTMQTHHQCSGSQRIEVCCPHQYLVHCLLTLFPIWDVPMVCAFMLNIETTIYKQNKPTIVEIPRHVYTIRQRNRSKPTTDHKKRIRQFYIIICTLPFKVTAQTPIKLH